ncbi:hypothetical protein HGG72_11840 [Ochrobactrum pecoris]|nr:hypothetical protein [Brucella pecoris]
MFHIYNRNNWCWPGRVWFSLLVRIIDEIAIIGIEQNVLMRFEIFSLGLFEIKDRIRQAVLLHEGAHFVDEARTFCVFAFTTIRCRDVLAEALWHLRLLKKAPPLATFLFEQDTAGAEFSRSL